MRLSHYLRHIAPDPDPDPRDAERDTAPPRITRPCLDCGAACPWGWSFCMPCLNEQSASDRIVLRARLGGAR